MSSAEKIPVGISQCLLGANVRFNGGHKKYKFCTQVMSKYFDFVDVCPEVNIGLGVPRKPIRLVALDAGTRAVETDDNSIDHTQALAQDGDQYAASHPELCGFIGAGGSPSCGVQSAKLYRTSGVPDGKVAGIFVQALSAEQTLLPMEDSGRLNDAGLRENFVLRVYTYHRWRQLLGSGLTPHKLIEFHAQHKYLVLAHSTEAYKLLGRLLSDLSAKPLDQLANDYIAGLMEGLGKPARRGQHCNVLQHLMGYLKNLLNSQDKKELADAIENYRRGVVPLVVPLALLNHHLQHHRERQRYVLNQVYLAPYPYELGLRSQLI